MLDRTRSTADDPPIHWCLSSRYGERFAFVVLDGGGVLLDLESGAFYRLNRVAAEVCAGLAREQSADDIAAALAATHGIPLDQARRDVEMVFARLTQPPAIRGVNPVRFESGPDGFIMRWQGRAVFRIDPPGATVTDLAAASADMPVAGQRLLWAVPHLLLLRGQFLLHAAAVQTPAGVLAFCGSSGTGKTTLAHAFAAYGRPLVAEDLVLLTFDGGVPAAITGAEPVVRRWAEEQAPLLAARGAVGTEALESVSRGERVRLDGIWFVERSAAAGPMIRREPLSQADALIGLLQNSFAELGEPALWRELLRTNHRLVTAISAVRAHCPEGLDRLRQAVAADPRAEG